MQFLKGDGKFKPEPEPSQMGCWQTRLRNKGKEEKKKDIKDKKETKKEGKKEKRSESKN